MEMYNGTNVTPGETSFEGALSKEGYLVTGLWVLTVGVMGTIGNSIVILVICKQWAKTTLARKPHLPLTLSLAISDLGITFFGYPYTAISGFAGRWLFNDTMCSVVGFSCFFLSMASLDALVAISVFRYIAVCRPELIDVEQNSISYTNGSTSVTQESRLTGKTTGLVIFSCWVYALLWSAPPLFGLSGYTKEPFGTSCTMDWASRKLADVIFLIGTDIFCFLLHLVILVFCYYKIFARYRFLTNIQENGNPGRSAIRREMRITWMSLTLVTAFVIVWSPYAIVCTVIVFSDNVPVVASTIPTMFAKSSCMFNPLLYGLLSTQFRKIAKRVVCPFLFRNVEPTNEIGRYMPRFPRRMDMFDIGSTEQGELSCRGDANNHGKESKETDYTQVTKNDITARRSSARCAVEMVEFKKPSAELPLQPKRRCYTGERAAEKLVSGDVRKPRTVTSENQPNMAEKHSTGMVLSTTAVKPADSDDIDIDFSLTPMTLQQLKGPRMNKHSRSLVYMKTTDQPNIIRRDSLESCSKRKDSKNASPRFVDFSRDNLPDKDEFTDVVSRESQRTGHQWHQKDLTEKSRILSREPNTGNMAARSKRATYCDNALSFLHFPRNDSLDRLRNVTRWSYNLCTDVNYIRNLSTGTARQYDNSNVDVASQESSHM